MPFIPLQIAKSSITSLLENEVAVIDSELGFALINAFSASRFEFQTVVNEDNTNVTMLTFWIPHDVKQNFPCSSQLRTKEEPILFARLSIVETYCHKPVHQVNHPDTRPKESIGAELVKSVIQALKKQTHRHCPCQHPECFSEATIRTS